MTLIRTTSLLSPIGMGCCLALTLAPGPITRVALAGGIVSAADYPSLQAAIDENPGRTINVAPGDHTIDAPLTIQHDRTVVEGGGRIVQTNPEAPIVRIASADHVMLRELTLARPAEGPDTDQPGIYAEQSDYLKLKDLRVIDNHSRTAAVRLEASSHGRIENCEVVNYKRITVDDRTLGPLYGYAFRCIDGTGIGVSSCIGTFILNNRIIENRLLPTRETADEHHLGQLTQGKAPTKFGELGRWVEKASFAQHWHQGSAIAVTGPEHTRFTRISGNYIENSAQGIDIHSDNFICTENTVNHGMMGMKAMHGSRNGIIANNLFSHVDLWGIMLGPGAASHHAQTGQDGLSERPANADGGIIVTGNVISDFGGGHEFWNWGGDGPDAAASAVIRIERGQLAANPALSDVLIQGNIITNAGDEGVVKDGQVTNPKPRYRYAVLIETQPADSTEGHYPANIRVGENLFEPGLDGICNVPLPSIK